MSTPLRLFILAGEPSGDRIAADLVRRLKERVPLELSGVGGDELQGQGLHPLFPMSDLAVMGVTDVLLNLPRLLWRLEQAARAILQAQPDIVVLVDAQDFSKLLARRLRSRGYSKPLILYVAPSVWARNPERAARLKPLFDAVFAVLPFEPSVMERLGGPPTIYVGHPSLGESSKTSEVNDSGPLILLPGIREGELRRHLPILRELAPELVRQPNVTELVLPTLPSLRARLSQEIQSWPTAVTLVDDRAKRQQLYSKAISAVCVSGTVTLELAMARVPMAVIYALDAHQSRIFEKLGKPDVSLPNIILGRTVVPEMVSRDLSSEMVGATVLDLIGNRKARQAQVDAFGELAELMEAGQPPRVREDPAEQVLALWRNQRLLIGS